MNKGLSHERIGSEECLRRFLITFVKGSDTIVNQYDPEYSCKRHYAECPGIISPYIHTPYSVLIRQIPADNNIVQVTLDLSAAQLIPLNGYAIRSGVFNERNPRGL